MGKKSDGDISISIVAKGVQAAGRSWKTAKENGSRKFVVCKIQRIKMELFVCLVDDAFPEPLFVNEKVANLVQDR